MSLREKYMAKETRLADLESFDLDKDQWLRLCGKSSSDAKVDAVVHNGAAVNWVASCSDLHKTNIDSAVQLLKIAIESTAFPKYVYISGGLKKRASETLEEFAAKLLSWAGYFQTKFVAESVIREIASRLPAVQNRISVVKPGLIIGTAASGAANTDDVLWRAVATAVGIGLTLLSIK
ncbi:male sterility protein domain-containing protein [Trichoderma breve]|uniref:Male sterility protein domain-containing protein n=1 Tax=Trichoderma breve TaxID=2034170 RepID=A0A9W9B611_9HYPO|nr:male sterility protein domain-containing protein [Trichoderma breve]KAJ4857125.1 male sterility protein domain-containing protein [Trichoderma breve]